MADQVNNHWSGTLTMANIDEVAKLIGEMLEGKRYAFVSAHEFLGFQPEVRTGQRLDPKGSRGGQAIHVHHHGDFSMFTVGDTYGLWDLSTHLADGEGDFRFSNPYISFDGDKISITHRSGAGHKIYWVVAIEHD